MVCRCPILEKCSIFHISICLHDTVCKQSCWWFRDCFLSVIWCDYRWAFYLFSPTSLHIIIILLFYECMLKLSSIPYFKAKTVVHADTSSAPSSSLIFWYTLKVNFTKYFIGIWWNRNFHEDVRLISMKHGVFTLYVRNLRQFFYQLSYGGTYVKLALSLDEHTVFQCYLVSSIRRTSQLFKLCDF